MNNMDNPIFKSILGRDTTTYYIHICTKLMLLLSYFLPFAKKTEMKTSPLYDKFFVFYIIKINWKVIQID